MEINWELVKMTNGSRWNERFVDTPTGRGESFVNKGRKMVIVWRHIKTDTVEKKIRGWVMNCSRGWYEVDVYTDFGKSCTVKADRTVTSEHYTLPDGTVVHNKWKIYDYL